MRASILLWLPLLGCHAVHKIDDDFSASTAVASQKSASVVDIKVPNLGETLQHFWDKVDSGPIMKTLPSSTVSDLRNAMTKITAAVKSSKEDVSLQFHVRPDGRGMGISANGQYKPLPNIPDFSQGIQALSSHQRSLGITVGKPIPTAVSKRSLLDADLSELELVMERDPTKASPTPSPAVEPEETASEEETASDDSETSTTATEDTVETEPEEHSGTVESLPPAPTEEPEPEEPTSSPKKKKKKKRCKKCKKKHKEEYPCDPPPEEAAAEEAAAEEAAAEEAADEGTALTWGARTYKNFLSPVAHVMELFTVPLKFTFWTTGMLLLFISCSYLKNGGISVFGYFLAMFLVGAILLWLGTWNIPYY